MRVVYGFYADPITSFNPPEYDPNNLEAMLILAKNAYEIRNFRRALYLLEKILKDYPDNQAAKEYYDLIVYGLHYPELIILEVTNFCKMGCKGCFANKEKGFMTFDQFKDIIDESAPYLKTLRLYNHGDAFYHPDIYKMLDYLKKYPHMEVYISTHGSFENFDAEAIVKSGTRLFLDFSGDGATQETYRQYRRNGNLEFVLSNMKKLMEARKKYNAKYPEVEWKYIVMKPNEHEMDKAIKMAEELDVDRLLFTPFSVGWFKVIRETPESLRAYVDDMAPTDRRYLFNDYDALVSRGFCGYRGIEFQHCFNVGRRKVVIAWNGDVSPCSCSKQPYLNVVGNVFEAGSFKAVWDSEKAREFRKQAVLDCRELEPCKNCHLVG